MTTQSQLDALLAKTKEKYARYNVSEKGRARRECSKPTTRDAKLNDMRIAVFDLETLPFENNRPTIEPFAGCLYYGADEYKVFWNDNSRELMAEVVAYLKQQKPSIIYIHNGGCFDFWFFLPFIETTEVIMKQSRLMKWESWGHEFRDSYSLVPAALRDAADKDEIEYWKFGPQHRRKYKKEIIAYLVSDCAYLLELVNSATELWGRKPLTIGMVAMQELAKIYPKRVANLPADTDAWLRQWFRGGRVDCFKGSGIFTGSYRYYDVNSMYPYQMADKLLPVGGPDTYKVSKGGWNGEGLPCFVSITCASRGCFPWQVDEGRTEYGYYIAPRRHLVTWPEYEMAMKYGLLDNVRIDEVIYSTDYMNFNEYITKYYQERLHWQSLKKRSEPGTRDYRTAHIQQMLRKLLMNNSYGKFAFDPSNYKEVEFFRGTRAELAAAYAERGKWDIEVEGGFDEDYFVVSRPKTDGRFRNVGTAAMITGHSRAYIMELKELAVDAIYSDTDSIICRSLPDELIDPGCLGKLKLEYTATEVGILGKKSYYVVKDNGETEIKAKGQEIRELSVDVMRALLRGEIENVTTKQLSPTFSLVDTPSKIPCDFGFSQSYLERTFRITAPKPGDIALAKYQYEQYYGRV